MTRLGKLVVLIDGQDRPSLIAATSFSILPHLRMCFMSCGCIPARSDGRSSQYSLGPGDLVADCVSYSYYHSNVAASIIYRLP